MSCLEGKIRGFVTTRKNEGGNDNGELHFKGEVGVVCNHRKHPQEKGEPPLDTGVREKTLVGVESAMDQVTAGGLNGPGSKTRRRGWRTKNERKTTLTRTIKGEKQKTGCAGLEKVKKKKETLFGQENKHMPAQNREEYTKTRVGENRAGVGRSSGAGKWEETGNAEVQPDKGTEESRGLKSTVPLLRKGRGISFLVGDHQLQLFVVELNFSLCDNLPQARKSKPEGPTRIKRGREVKKWGAD